MISIKSALSFLVLSIAGANAQCILTAGNVNLLSAQGLATPWELSGACSMADPNTQNFIEATVYEPALNQLFAYAPLVINAGTTPLVPPVVPNITNQAIISYYFGSNANTLTLADKTGGNTLNNAQCVNGVQNSVFGQFAYCNGLNLVQVAGPALHAANKIPPLGTAKDGTPCPTTRSFAIVDQDQSDNVVTTYLLVGNQTAQNTAANLKKFPKATVVANPSDNALLQDFVLPAIGCKGFTFPALDDPGAMRGTLAGDEISANFLQAAPVALVPMTDPMVLNNGNPDITKTNKYRAGVGQQQGGFAEANGTTYCMNLGQIAPPVILRQGPMTSVFTTPAAAVGTTLFTFLGARFAASWTNLNCQALTGMASPITPTVDGNGVATALTFNINGMVIGPTTVGGTMVGSSSAKASMSSTMMSSTSAAASTAKTSSAAMTAAASSSTVKAMTSAAASSTVKTMASAASSSTVKAMTSAAASSTVKTMASAASSSAVKSTSGVVRTVSVPTLSTSAVSSTAAGASVITTPCTMIHTASVPALSSPSLSSSSAAAALSSSSAAAATNVMSSSSVPAAASSSMNGATSTMPATMPTATATMGGSTTGGSTCNGQPFNPATSVCVNGIQICPTTASSVCGTTCYNPSQFTCSGPLICPVSAPNACGRACFAASQNKCCNNVIVPLTQTC